MFEQPFDESRKAAGVLRTEGPAGNRIENAPQAFLDMMRGGNVGKMVVRTAR